MGDRLHSGDISEQTYTNIYDNKIDGQTVSSRPGFPFRLETVFGHTRNRGCGIEIAICGFAAAAKIICMVSSLTCFTAPALLARTPDFPHMCGLVVAGCTQLRSKVHFEVF